MKQHTYRPVTFAAAALTVAAQGAATNTPPAQAAVKSPPPSAFEQFTRDTKNPLSWLSWGGDFRLRNEYVNNCSTLSQDVAFNEQDYFRFRGRLWLSLKPIEGVSLNGRLCAEPRNWVSPTATSGEGMEWRFGIIDDLNVKLTRADSQFLTVVAGRQEISLGELSAPWLICDGTPLDGTWTFFLDSARATFNIKDYKTKVDVVGIYQQSDPGGAIPTIGSSDGYALTEQNETGAILYASNQSIENTTVDGYFIYKGDDQVRANGDNADIYTFGGRVAGNFGGHWQYSAEGAYQFGQKEDPTVINSVNPGAVNRDLSAFGVNGRFGYAFKDKLANQAYLVFEYLSGDDSTTPEDEMFDILWGRCPRWGDVHNFSFGTETGGRACQLNNVMRVGPSWTLNPIKGMSITTMYNALFAPQEDPTRRRAAATALYSYDGNFRGHFASAIIKHTFNTHVSARLQGEIQWEGDYYAQSDTMSFIRAEMNFTW